MRGSCCAAAFLAAALVVGCSGGGDYGDVSGTVTYDGTPVEDGQIKFEPADGKGQTGGAAIKGGKYAATKVSVGKMKVSVSGSKVTGKKKMYPTPDSPEMPITSEYLPAKYNDKTELTFDVKRGANEKNWELPK